MRITLPDGLTIEAFSAFEASVLYREIVAEATYLKHGITLADGARVFDVGANIGLFAIHIARTVPGAQIRCFEPVSPTFALLRRNLADHAPHVVAVQAGISSSEGTATFEFDPNSSFSASMTPAVFAPAALPKAPFGDWARGGVADLVKIDPRPAFQMLHAAFDRAWSRPIALGFVAVAGAMLELRKRLSLRRESCVLRTISGEIAASGFDAIDLVKIDVEGAEEDVLTGIADRDWMRIRQFVIEVHDIDGRRDRLGALLRSRGYHVIFDREDWALHRLMAISTIYAVRR